MDGNGNNASNNCYSFLVSNIYQYFEGYNFLTVDYPGYGLSEGTPSDVSLFETGLTVYDYAYNLDFVDKNNIIVIGYSIGTGVATYTASQRNVNSLILLAPYDTGINLYNSNLNIFYGSVKLLAKYKFNSIDYASNVKTKPLIFTSYNDEAINYKFAVNLSKEFKNLDEIIILDNVGHNDYLKQENVLKRIQQYLQNRL